MYTFEERMKAVELYIQSGYSEGIVIRTLGYPARYVLKPWILEIRPELLEKHRASCTESRNRKQSKPC